MKLALSLLVVLSGSSAFAYCGKTNSKPITEVCLISQGKKTGVELRGKSGKALRMVSVKNLGTTGYGEQGGGDITTGYEMRAVNEDGELAGPRYRVYVHKSWFYSDGYVDVKGNSPAGKFSAVMNDEQN